MRSLGEAIRLQDDEKFEAATEIYRELFAASDSASEKGFLLLNIARCQALLEHFENAWQSLERARSLLGDDAVSQLRSEFTRAEISSWEENTIEAEQILRRILSSSIMQSPELIKETDSEDLAVASVRLLGIVSVQLHKNDEAIRILSKIFADDPFDNVAGFYLASALIEIGQLEPAREVIEKAMTLTTSSRWKRAFSRLRDSHNRVG